jgi:hypothetical protein
MNKLINRVSCVSLLKSKFFLGALVVAVMFVGAVAVNAPDASAAHCSITSTLRVGSKGDQVRCLQGAVGVSADGNFGPLTKSAVMAWQSSVGLTADGVFGPLSNATWMASHGGSAMTYPAGCTSGTGFSSTTGMPCTGTPVAGLPAGCTSTAGYSPTTGMSCSSAGSYPAGCTSAVGYSPTTGASCSGGSAPTTPGVLVGGAGSITVTASGEYSSENIGEGDEDVMVMAVDVEADSNSDVELLSTKVEFIQNTAGDPKQLWKYATEVSVWLEGKKVGRVNTKSFSKSGNYYSATISLSGAKIRAGDEKELAFAVSAQSSLDSSDIDTDDWNIDLINVRLRDGSGVVLTESLDPASTAGGTYMKSFDFDTFATATGASLTLTLEDDAINNVHLLDVDDTRDTSHPITSILMYAKGSTILVDEMVSTITTTGETNESVIIISSWIEVDGVRISDKEDVPNGGVVTYNNLDRIISAGDKEEWIFWVEVQEVNGALDDGDTVQLTVDTSGTVAEDKSGDAITAKGLDPVGGAHPMYDNAIRLTGTSQSAQAFTIDGANNDRIELTLNFDVFNYGEITLYIPNMKTLTGTPSSSTTTTAPSTSEGVGYHIQTAGTVTPGSNDISAILSNGKNLTLKTNSYELKSGKKGTLTLKITVATDGNPSIDNVAFRALLAGVGWATSDTATSAVVYTANLEEYKTDYATIAD